MPQPRHRGAADRGGAPLDPDPNVAVVEPTLGPALWWGALPRRVARGECPELLQRAGAPLDGGGASRRRARRVAQLADPTALARGEERESAHRGGGRRGALRRSAREALQRRYLRRELRLVELLLLHGGGRAWQRVRRAGTHGRRSRNRRGCSPREGRNGRPECRLRRDGRRGGGGGRRGAVRPAHEALVAVVVPVVPRRGERGGECDEDEVQRDVGQDDAPCVPRAVVRDFNHLAVPRRETVGGWLFGLGRRPRRC